jgi:hypothetical protein
MTRRNNWLYYKALFFGMLKKFHLPQSFLRLGFSFVTAKRPAGLFGKYNVFAFYFFNHNLLLYIVKR